MMYYTDQMESTLNDGDFMTNEFDRAFQTFDVERDPKFIFSIKFGTKPLGIDITSSEYGTCAYVTDVDGKKNKAIENKKLPLNSKVIKVNDKTVENYKFQDILDLIHDGLETLPLVLTFCDPDGLEEEERPDDPKVNAE